MDRELGPPGEGALRERWAHLDGLRAAGIAMVVVHHALGYCVPLSLPGDQLVRFAVVTVGVPIFFLADGYLLARGAEQTGARPYGAFVRRSAARLLVPWAAFSALYAVLRYAFEAAGVLGERTIVGRLPSEVALSVVRSVYAPQLYFLVSLFLLRLLQPASLRLARGPRGWLPVLVVLFTLVYRLSDALLPRWFGVTEGQDPVVGALWGWQYYVAGIALWRFEPELSRRPAAFGAAALAAAVVLRFGWGGATWVFWGAQYAYLIGAYLLFLGLPRVAAALAPLGANTMGVYLLHTPVLLKGVSLAVNRVVSTPLASLGFIAVATLGASYAGARLLAGRTAGALLLGVVPRVGRCPEGNDSRFRFGSPDP